MDAALFMNSNLDFILVPLFLSVGVVWLIFPFVAMAKLRLIREEMEMGNRYLADLSKRIAMGAEVAPRPTVRIAPVARAVTETVPPVNVMPTTGVISPPSVVPLKISKGGLKVDLKDTTSIKVMLKKGELSLKDRYFDAKSNRWVMLCHHIEFRQ